MGRSKRSAQGMFVRGPCVIVLALAPIVACTTERVDAPSHDTSAITHGAPTSADPPIVAIVTDGLVGCTGVVLHPRVVATAAHCLVPTMPSAVIVGSTADATASIPVTRGRRHPDASTDTMGSDVAYLILAAPAPVTPARTGSLSPGNVGAVVRVEGFGQTAPDDTSAPTKREGTSTIVAVDARTVTLGDAPSQPCRGDSGGPVFLGDDVVAIVSEGDSACAHDASAARLDANADFFGPVVREAAASNAPVGAACVVNENCASSQCISLDVAPAFPLCSTACNVDDDCPSPTSCRSFGTAPVQRWCAPAVIPGALGTPCVADLGCDSESCAEDPGVGPVCTELCFATDPASCPAGFACRSNDAAGAADAGDGDAVGHCFPISERVSAGGGCTAGRGAASSRTPWLSLVLITLGALARRRSMLSS